MWWSINKTSKCLGAVQPSTVPTDRSAYEAKVESMGAARSLAFRGAWTLESGARMTSSGNALANNVVDPILMRLSK
jgi:hypothetical protein